MRRIHEAQQINYEALLMEYAAGALDQAQSLIVSAHLSLVPEAREMVHVCETVTGVLIEKTCTPAPMDEMSLQNVLGRIDAMAQPPQPQRRSPFPEDLCDMPECIEEYIIIEEHQQLHWKRRTRGIRSFALPLECRESRAHMFKLDPGIHTPSHTHRGLEITLVLDGAFMDEVGEYKKGDLIVSDPETPEHSQAACPKNGCVCLSVFTAPVRLSGLMGILMNPFLKI